jgi:hypothetical protein
MLPNYDRKSNEFVDRKVKSHHFGIIVENVVLNTRVSFHWRPQIDNNVMKELNDWATGVSDVPVFIFTGMYRFKNDIGPMSGRYSLNPHPGPE